MYFGLTSQDIINAFPPITSETSLGGTTSVNNEIALQYAKLMSLLPVAMQKTLNGNRIGEVVVVEGISGGYYVDIDFAAKDHEVGLYASNALIEDVTLCNCKCYSTTDVYDYDKLTYVSGNRYQITDNTFVYNEDAIYKVAYQVDAANSTNDALKALLRDMVACAIGSRIFPSTDQWTATKYYCESAKDTIANYRAGNIPPEFLLNKLSGIATINFMR